jgi:hypothetical protein
MLEPTDNGLTVRKLTAAEKIAHSEQTDRGGDDVVSKPFSHPELRGRIRALLRRAYEPRHTPASRVGTLAVDHRTREVRVGEQAVALSAKEFALLQALIADPTRVFTKHERCATCGGSANPGALGPSTRTRRACVESLPRRAPADGSWSMYGATDSQSHKKEAELRLLLVARYSRLMNTSETAPIRAKRKRDRDASVRRWWSLVHRWHLCNAAAPAARSC